MVHVPTLQALRSHYNSNLKRYIKERPGQYVLLEMSIKGINETFFRTAFGLNNATSKYKNTFGPGIVAENIPVKTHRFNPENKTLEFRITQHVIKCPNDNETMLVPHSGIEIDCTPKESEKYREWAGCPDCGYKVQRRPSERMISETKKAMEKMVFK